MNEKVTWYVKLNWRIFGGPNFMVCNPKPGGGLFFGNLNDVSVPKVDITYMNTLANLMRNMRVGPTILGMK